MKWINGDTTDEGQSSSSDVSADQEDKEADVVVGSVDVTPDASQSAAESATSTDEIDEGFDSSLPAMATTDKDGTLVCIV